MQVERSGATFIVQISRQTKVKDKFEVCSAFEVCSCLSRSNRGQFVQVTTESRDEAAKESKSIQLDRRRNYINVIRTMEWGGGEEKRKEASVGVWPPISLCVCLHAKLTCNLIRRGHTQAGRFRTMSIAIESET